MQNFKCILTFETSEIKKYVLQLHISDIMLTIKCFYDVTNNSILGSSIPQGQYRTNANLRILQKDTIFEFNFTSKAHKTSL